LGDGNDSQAGPVKLGCTSIRKFLVGHLAQLLKTSLLLFVVIWPMVVTSICSIIEVCSFWRQVQFTNY